MAKTKTQIENASDAVASARKEKLPLLTSAHVFVEALSTEWIEADRPQFTHASKNESGIVIEYAGKLVTVTRNIDTVKLTVSGTFRAVTSTAKITDTQGNETEKKGYSVVFVPRVNTVTALKSAYGFLGYQPVEVDARIFFDAGRQLTTDIRNVAGQDVRESLNPQSSEKTENKALADVVRGTARSIASGSADLSALAAVLTGGDTGMATKLAQMIAESIALLKNSVVKE